MNVPPTHPLSLLTDIIRKDAISRTESGAKIVSPTGETQAWLLDLRPVLLNPHALNMITDLFWEKFEKTLPFQIGGMESASIPLVTALLLKAHQKGLNVSGFMIRKERKLSGLGRNIEGTITDEPVILVDDILNSGNSLEKARAILAAENLSIRDIFVVVDYNAPQGLAWRQHNNLKVTSLFNDIGSFGLSFEMPRRTMKLVYKVLWRSYEKGAFPFNVVPKSTPLLLDDRLFMGNENGKMVCIDAKSGEKKWEFDVKTTHPKGIWSSPTHHDGKIYFGAYNGNVYCLEAKTGKLVWNNPACEFVGSSPLIVPEHGLLYLGLEYQRPRGMGSNAAFKLENGERVWETGQKKYQHGSAAYYKPKDLVIFGNADHDVSAYEAKTGKLIWKHETERSLKYPAFIDSAGKRVITASFDGNIYVLNAETGERIAAIKTDDICYTTPLLADGKIFCGSGDRHMYVIDAKTCQVIRKIYCRARVYSSPKLIGGNVVFGTNGGHIYELDTQSLEFVGQVMLPDAVTNAVSVSPDGKTLYASTHMNELYAIERKNVGA